MSDLARLKSQLLTSGIAEKQQAVFQILNSLIDAVQAIPGPTPVFTINAAKVATLPPNAVKASMFYVTDALVPVVGAAVAGGGAAFAAVMWNGAQWTVFSI